MTPYLIRGVTMFRTIGKSLDAVGSVGGFISDTVTAGGAVSNIIKEKVSSSIEEEKIEQAKNRILVKAAAIKEIAEALGCDLITAEQFLEEELKK